MFFLGVGTNIIGAASNNIGLNPFQIGLLIAFQNVGFGISVLITGAMADTRSKPVLLGVGSVILAASFYLYYLWGGFVLNLLIMLVMGIGIGTYEGVADALLLGIQKKRQSFFISINHFFVTFGSLIIAIYLIFLQMDWRRSMTQSAVLVGALAVLFFFERTEQGLGGKTKVLDRYRNIGKGPVVFVLFFAAMCAVSTEMVALGIIPTFLIELRGFSLVTSKIGLVVFLAGIACGRVILGFIATKERIVGIILFLFGLEIVLSSITYFVPMSDYMIYTMLFLYGANVSVIFPLIITLAGLRFPEMAGTAMSFIKLGIPIAGIISPVVLSLLSRYTGFASALFIFPTVGAIGFVLSLMNRKKLALDTGKTTGI